MHFQYLVRNVDGMHVTLHDTNRIASFLHRQEERTYSCDASDIGLDVVNFKDENQGILPEHLKIIKNFGYEIEPTETEIYTGMLKELYPEPATRL